MTELEKSKNGQVSGEASDELLSRLLDDAFYGRTLLAVTGAQGGDQSRLSKRFASQFASEAECLSVCCSDFLDRDKFLSLLVSLLGPEAVEYAGDSDLLTIADYAGSLADQERLLIILLEEAESLAPALLDTLYELVDEADEASLSCVLLGDSSLQSVIERADPDGGVEDFTWYTVPAGAQLLPNEALEGGDEEDADQDLGMEQKEQPGPLAAEELEAASGAGGGGGESESDRPEYTAQDGEVAPEATVESELHDEEEGFFHEENLLLDFALAEDAVEQVSRDLQADSVQSSQQSAARGLAGSSEPVSDPTQSPPAGAEEEASADRLAEDLEQSEETGSGGAFEEIVESVQEQAQAQDEALEEALYDTAHSAAEGGPIERVEAIIEAPEAGLESEPGRESSGRSPEEQATARGGESNADEGPASELAPAFDTEPVAEDGPEAAVKELDPGVAIDQTADQQESVAALLTGEASADIDSGFDEGAGEGSVGNNDGFALDAAAESALASTGAENESQASDVAVGYDDEIDDEIDNDFDRDIDDWLEPDSQPRIGSAASSALEFDFDDELDDDLEDNDEAGVASARNQAQKPPRSPGAGLIATLTSSTAAAVHSVKGLAALLLERLAAGRLYWFATAALAFAFIAVLAFWRIPEEPPQGRIELASPLAGVDAASAQGAGIQETGADDNPVPVSTNPPPSSQVAVSPRIPPAVRQDSLRDIASPARAPSSPVADQAPRAREADVTATATAGAAAQPRTVEQSTDARAPRPAPESAAATTAAGTFAEALLAAPPTSYTLQILGTSSAAAAEEFVAQNAAGLRQTLGYYATVRAGQPWYVVSYGVFTQRSDAQATLRRLPSRLSAAGPWVRQLASVQATIR